MSLNFPECVLGTAVSIRHRPVPLDDALDTLYEPNAVFLVSP